MSFLKNSFVNLFLAALGLHCFAQDFSGWGEQSLPSNCDAWPSHCGGFSCRGTRAPELWLTGLVASVWTLCRPGVETVSPALAGGFLTTGPPGKSPFLLFLNYAVCSTL